MICMLFVFVLTQALAPGQLGCLCWTLGVWNLLVSNFTPVQYSSTQTCFYVDYVYQIAEKAEADHVVKL